MIPLTYYSVRRRKEAEMRTIPRNRRYIDILSLSISLFLFLAIFANCSTGFQIPLDDHLQADREDSLFVSRHTSVNIVTVDVRSASQSHRALTNTASRKSTAFKTFKSVLAACSVVCMYIFYQYRIHRISEKTASRSQSFIIRFIHNADGKKD